MDDFASAGCDEFNQSLPLDSIATIPNQRSRTLSIRVRKTISNRNNGKNGETNRGKGKPLEQMFHEDIRKVLMKSKPDTL